MTRRDFDTAHEQDGVWKIVGVENMRDILSPSFSDLFRESMIPH